ncbi:MAG: D-2-hydroxyacid dehydrogenase [Chthoniobacter sp.]|nr:D-2-hydroxyacid dehydrogenase [Chthoniobacter sp.]
MSLTIWTNAHFSDAPRAALVEGAQPHRLILSTQLSASNLAKAAPDPTMQEADVAFGQPDPEFALQCPRLRWIHLTTAGYTRYDGAAFRQAFGGRGSVLTNSSLVYNEPCAEHVLAFMMAQARQLMPSLDTQRTDRAWPTLERRAVTSLLLGQSVVLLGFGAIGHRLAELLAPFHVKITAVRRRPAGDENVTVVTEDKLTEALATADHVVNVLPENPATVGFVNAARLAATKPGAIFYNVGRGTTVDQVALLAALQSGHLDAAYLDVTDPEPLPPEHPLWSAPNCYITPHSAGGHSTEPQRLVQHFLDNLRRFEKGEALQDRVI